MSNNELGRYRLLSELGRGAMGHVFLAHDPEIDRNVALKTIRILGALPQADRDETRDRVIREARAAGKLLHPGIVTLFDVGEADGTLYLAMEHVEGETLDAFCRPDRLLPVETVVEMLAGVAEALEYAHHAGVVHRDVKPANLMRVGDSRAKIMDFGLARVAEGHVTHEGTLLGTPSYMSPEQIRGGEIDGRSDLFSLGVVLFEMLTGERPFAGDSVSSIIYRVVNEPPRDLETLGERVPRPLRAFLRRALAKNPDDRYPHGGAFAAALREAGSATQRSGEDPLVELDRAVPEAKIPPRSSSQRRKRSSLPWVFVLLLLAVVLGAAGWTFRDRLPLDRLPLDRLPAMLRPEPKVVWLETKVRTEPPDLPVTVNGEPLDAAAAGSVRFAAGGEPVVVATSKGCRTVEETLEPEDAGGEVVLLVESERFSGSYAPGVPGATVELDGKSLGAAPVELDLDLCEPHELVVSADGYREATLALEPRMRPVDVRTALAALTPEAIPDGRLRLPKTAVDLVFYLDGNRLDSGTSEIDAPEGTHRLRYKNDTYWIDGTADVQIVAGETVTADVSPPPLTRLVVQAFPANCTVHLRRPGGRWKEIGETPLEKRIAAGTYEVRVTFNPTGKSKDSTVRLAAGDNPPLRVSLGGG